MTRRFSETYRFVGVDVSARRGLDVAVLDSAGRVLSVERLSTSSGTAGAELLALARRQGECVVAIDAPQALRRAPRRREVDRQLVSRSIFLYQVPQPNMPPAAQPEWMRVGFALFTELLDHGWRLPSGPSDLDATLLEIYPYASFTTLLGRWPTKKNRPSGLEERRQVLIANGLIGLPPGASHDVLDALGAALTALRYSQGAGGLVGDPLDGYMALPIPIVALKLRYRKEAI